jgi:hypothetical protein
VKRAILAILFALCGACKQQDPALMISVSGQFLIPQGGDKLHLEIYDVPGGIIRGKDWCAKPTPGCDTLPPMPQGLSATLTIVESGSAHQHVKINLELLLGSATVGLGTATTDFQPGQTVEIPIVVTRPQ